MSGPVSGAARTACPAIGVTAPNGLPSKHSESGSQGSSRCPAVREHPVFRTPSLQNTKNDAALRCSESDASSPEPEHGSALDLLIALARRLLLSSGLAFKVRRPYALSHGRQRSEPGLRAHPIATTLRLIPAVAFPAAIAVYRDSWLPLLAIPVLLAVPVFVTAERVASAFTRHPWERAL